MALGFVVLRFSCSSYDALHEIVHIATASQDSVPTPATEHDHWRGRLLQPAARTLRNMRSLHCLLNLFVDTLTHQNAWAKMCICCLWAHLGRTQGDIICITSAIRRLYAAFGLHFSLSGHGLISFSRKLTPKVTPSWPLRCIKSLKSVRKLPFWSKLPFWQKWPFWSKWQFWSKWPF